MVAVMLLLIALGVTPSAMAAERVVLRIEQSDPRGKQQQALVLEEKKVALARNSNFLCAAGNDARLGEFVARDPERLRGSRELLEQLGLRARKRPSAGGAPASPHGTRVYLGDSEVTSQASYVKTAAGIARAQCALSEKDWTPVDAVSVTRERKDGEDVFRFTEWKASVASTSRAARPGEVQCEDEGAVQRCRIGSWGTAYFR